MDKIREELLSCSSQCGDLGKCALSSSIHQLALDPSEVIRKKDFSADTADELRCRNTRVRD